MEYSRPTDGCVLIEGLESWTGLRQFPSGPAVKISGVLLVRSSTFLWNDHGIGRGAVQDRELRVRAVGDGICPEVVATSGNLRQQETGTFCLCHLMGDFQAEPSVHSTSEAVHVLHKGMVGHSTARVVREKSPAATQLSHVAVDFETTVGWKVTEGVRRVDPENMIYNF